MVYINPAQANGFVCLELNIKRLEGKLRLELPKQVYERTGLNGQAIQDEGRKHVKTRYSIVCPISGVLTI